MLRFERQVVRGLVHGDDDELRGGVESFVDGTLRAMPEYLRAGIATASIGLSGWARVRSQVRPAAGDVVAALDASALGPVRQYVRLFRSLVLFAEHELSSTATGTAA